FFSLPGAAFALSFSAESRSSTFAEATAGESPAPPIAASRTHPVQSPSGASEKIFAPQLRQILITRIITGASLRTPPSSTWQIFAIRYADTNFTNLHQLTRRN